jgi:hypothetical protein
LRKKGGNREVGVKKEENKYRQKEKYIDRCTVAKNIKQERERDRERCRKREKV